MHRQFKFKYASELAGTFVILAIVILLTGFFLAGRAQGWLEGKFTLYITFNTEEGSFGLQEGNEVRIMNTLAGRVGQITPTEDGSIATTLVIQNRFKQFVSRNSTAKVRKKFGVAGDSYIDIEMGNGDLIADGDPIICSKDEEIMETAQRALKNIQDVVLPMLENVQQILDHVNGITASVEQGKGIAGTVLNDREMANDVRQAINKINMLLTESTETFEETTRLVKGFQKSWLVRKHIETEDDDEFLMPLGFNAAEMRERKDIYEKKLNLARAADDSAEITRNAYNLAVCLLAEGNIRYVKELIPEMRAESESNEQKVRIMLLESELARIDRKTEHALDLAQSALDMIGKSDRNLTVQCRLMIASLHCDLNKKEEAHAQLKKVQSSIKKVNASLQAFSAHQTGRLFLIENKPDSAAAQFDMEAEIYRGSGAYYHMAEALVCAASIYDNMKKHDLAADRYFRAGRSLAAGDYVDPAHKALALALSAAGKTDDNQDLADQIRTLIARLETR